MIFSPWPGRAVIACDIADPESQFEADELAVIRGFARPKRQTEWMLSRIAEKELRRNGVSGDCVSFSHSGKYGAAAIDAQPLGIDIEMIREISENAAHLFLTDDEIEIMGRCRITHRMLHFWSAKEALWKQRGGSVPTLRRVPLTLESETVAGLRFRGAETVAIGELIAAITLPTA
ncbi:MAG: 4'-phosphopantetheinyl transferase superfamily protein [Acidobacteriota bacterium]|nr:4'-phosphopantetheinyl transferase superfamily protein [Acidobacteriota bacterium]